MRHRALVVPWRHMSGWIDSHEVNMWFAHVPHRFVVTYNPGADGRSVHNASTGGTFLDAAVLLEHTRPALRYVASYGGATHDQQDASPTDPLARCVGEGGTHVQCSAGMFREANGSLPCRLCTRIRLGP